MNDSKNIVCVTYFHESYMYSSTVNLRSVDWYVELVNGTHKSSLSDTTHLLTVVTYGNSLSKSKFCTINKRRQWQHHERHHHRHRWKKAAIVGGSINIKLIVRRRTPAKELNTWLRLILASKGGGEISRPKVNFISGGSDSLGSLGRAPAS